MSEKPLGKMQAAAGLKSAVTKSNPRQYLERGGTGRRHTPLRKNIRRNAQDIH